MLLILELASPSEIRVFCQRALRTSNSSIIVRVSVVEPVPPKFEAEIVTENFPPTVGVPVMAPVEVLMLSPAGRFAAL